MYEVVWAFPGGAVLQNLPASAGNAERDAGSIPESGRSPREGNGNTFQFSCLENHGQRSLEGYRSWIRKRVGLDLQLNDNKPHINEII